MNSLMLGHHCVLYPLLGWSWVNLDAIVMFLHLWAQPLCWPNIFVYYTKKKALMIIVVIIHGQVVLWTFKKAVYILNVKTHFHKALTFFVQYAFILYRIWAFYIIYISACTSIKLSNKKKLGYLNNVGMKLLCSCLHVCKGNVWVFVKLWLCVCWKRCCNITV